MNNVLTLSNVTRCFTQGANALQVLKNVNLTLARGEMVALVGPSGSGKSTLLQITGLLDAPTSGDVIIMNENVSRANDAVRTNARKKHIGFVYQAHHLLPDFSAQENIALPLLIAGNTRAHANARANELLAAMQLAERAHHRPAQLSGGEQQRVAIARALAASPSLLLADEPTGNLDPATADVVFAFLERMIKQANVAALIATHNMELARRMHRTLTLKNGELVSL